MSRIPELERHQLTPEQTHVYDAVLASRGALHGPFRVWLHSPEFADRAQKLGEYARFQTSLDDRMRELAILVTARFWDAQIEWSTHEPAARKAGISAAAIDDVKNRRSPGFEQSDEESVYRYTLELLRDHFVSDDVFADAVEHLGVCGIVELTLLIGYYSMVAFSLNAFRVEVPPDIEPLLIDTPQKR